MSVSISSSERELLRQSVRSFLSAHWPADKAVENANDADAMAKLWTGFARQGLASLGADPDEAGLREIVLVFEELGRASCPAPLLGAVAANLTLAVQPSNAARALLEDLHQGKANIALGLGAFDGDVSAGQVTQRGDTLQGRLFFVEATQGVTHFLMFTSEPAGIAVVARDASGLTMRATPGLAVPPFVDLSFDDTPALRIGISPDALADVAWMMRLACAGRASGAAERAFGLAVDNAKVRKQFGQLIGQFQAVQHKLANCLISLDGARLAVESAAEAYDRGDPAWRVFVSSAIAFASPALRNVSIETHRALGAIGYAEEHEAPRHFRRVHADLARFGGVSRARAELADAILGPIG